MADVKVRDYKEHRFPGGTLLVSIPYVGLGNNLLTDWLLDHLKMDHVAAVDSFAFPPLAMLHHGKARFPFRIHGDTATGVAVLRSDFPSPAPMARPLAQAVLAWAKEKGFVRVVCLDGLQALGPQANGDGAPDRDAPPVLFAATSEPTRERARKAGLLEFAEGVMGGVPAVMLLEGQLRALDVMVLIAEIRGPVEDARSVLAFAEALAPLVPPLKIDKARLRKELGAVEASVKALHEEARRTVDRLDPKEPEPSKMYA